MSLSRFRHPCFSRLEFLFDRLDFFNVDRVLLVFDFALGLALLLLALLTFDFPFFDLPLLDRRRLSLSRRARLKKKRRVVREKRNEID